MPRRGSRGGRGACPGHATARAPSAPAAPRPGWPSLRRAGFGSPSSSRRTGGGIKAERAVNLATGAAEGGRRRTAKPQGLGVDGRDN